MIDSNGKIFGKISVVDLMIVLIIAAVIFGAGYKLTKSHSVVLSKADKVTVEFFADEAPDFALGSVRVGDVVGDFEKGAIFGKVTSISLDKSKSVGQAASGEYVATSKPGFGSAHFVVEGEAVKNIDGGISVNNADYFIGRQIIVKAGNGAFMARIFQIK